MSSTVAVLGAARASGMAPWRRRALGVAAGLLLDRALGEPPTRVHPVVWFGRAMTGLERRVWRDDRAAGAAYAAVGVGLGLAAGRAVRWTAPAVALAVGGRMLRETGRDIEDRLVAGDVAGARAALPALVGRDPSDLDASGVSAAVVESLAENTVDAVVAPALWGLVAGAPGALVYRAVNTMDAMVGHRSERYARFGTAAARLDDVASYVPARACAALVALAEPRSARRVARLVRRDARAHPSPNSGVAETAVSAVLGRELGGPLRYGERTERRPRLGDGPRPDPADITHTRRLVDRAELTLAGGLVAAAVLTPRRKAS